MSTPSRFFAILSLVMLTASPVAADGWVALFDGRTLDGWTQRAGDPARRGTFHVEEGCIVGTYVAGTRNTFLATDREFGDFVLTFEFDVPAGANSGVQFRSAMSEAGSVAGYQFEIDPSPRAWSGGVYHEAGRGWLYPVDQNPPAKELLRREGWNRARIECVGDSIRTWLNGAPVAHLIDDRLERGFIALQVHGIPEGAASAGRTVRFREIRIDETPTEPTPPDAGIFVRNLVSDRLAPAEEAVGWRFLFDGRDLSAWRGVGREDFPAKGWRIEDGQLVVEGRGGGDIVTRAEFGAFELQLEFLLTPGANSGVKYCVQERGDGDGPSALGLEYQLLDDARHADAKAGVDGNRTLASLYDLIPSARHVSTRDVPRHVGRWNHARIVSRADGTVEHWLNGFRVVRYTRGDDAFRALVARSKYRDHEGFGLGPRGRILLQDHGDEVRFRSIRIRALD